jgi:hypothetical protein
VEFGEVIVQNFAMRAVYSAFELSFTMIAAILASAAVLVLLLLRVINFNNLLIVSIFTTFLMDAILKKFSNSRTDS